jgi:hypothetical protein
MTFQIQSQTQQGHAGQVRFEEDDGSWEVAAPLLVEGAIGGDTFSERKRIDAIQSSIPKFSAVVQHGTFHHPASFAT